MATLSTQTDLSVGLDVEIVGAVTPDIAELTMSDTERRWVATSEHAEVMATVVFAAKEALYKAQHPLTAAWLDFTDVEVSAGMGSNEVRMGLAVDVPAVERFDWPITACWTEIEPKSDLRLVGAAVVIR